MAFWNPIYEQIAELKKLSPANLKKLANQKMTDIVSRELGRARKRVADLEQLYPSAGTRELGQRLIDNKKSVAYMVGGVSGVFGLISVPADLVIVAWLQLVLLTEIATLYKVNLKSEGARKEVLDIFFYANGIGPATRASPKLLGRAAAVLLEKGGLETLGRAMPLVAAPITAYLNNQHIQRVGDEALRRYEGFGKAQEKSRRKASGE